MAQKTVKAWGGFCDGKLHFDFVDTGFGGFGVCQTEMPAIFRKRALARREYQDVRRIEITYETGK